MLLNRILVGILCAVIVAGGLFFGLSNRFFDRALTEAQQEEFKEKIELPRNFTIAASPDGATAVRNSMESIEECIRSGCDAIELNIAFSPYGTPYLADGPEYLTSASVSLESVFQKYAKQDYLRFLLHINDLTQSVRFYKLADEYKLFGRIILTGLSLEDADKASTYFPGFLIAYDLNDSAFVSLKDADACAELVIPYVEKGAYAITCSASSVTAELVEAIRVSGVNDVIVRDADSAYDIFYVLSLNPDIIISATPNKLYDVMRSEDYLDNERFASF